MRLWDLTLDAIAYWDKLMDLFYTLVDKVEEKKSACFSDSEFEDYADCDL